MRETAKKSKKEKTKNEKRKKQEIQKKRKMRKMPRKNGSPEGGCLGSPGRLAPPRPGTSTPPLPRFLLIVIVSKFIAKTQIRAAFLLCLMFETYFRPSAVTTNLTKMPPMSLGFGWRREDGRREGDFSTKNMFCFCVFCFFFKKKVIVNLEKWNMG